MESRTPGPNGPADLQNLRIDVLREAVAIYMALSYPDQNYPPSVAKRLVWAEESDPVSLLGQAPFETVGKNKPTGTTIYALRLGNSRYPHMKLQIQPWPNPSLAPPFRRLRRCKPQRPFPA